VSDPLDGLRALARGAMFPVDGDVSLEGLREPVTVRRDAWGVPYVEAASLEDLWFAHGVVTAGERLFQLELTLRAANGRLSELFGDRTLDDDRLARTVGFHRAGARIAAGWDERSRSMHARFRAGVRAWVEAMPAAPLEYTLLDTQPWMPDDEAVWASAFVLLAWGLSGNWDTELLRAWIAEASGGGSDLVSRLLPPVPADAPEVVPGALAGALFDATPRAKGQGSNAWVVAGSRTASGAPLLANDPHLLAVQPGIWLECHLSAPGYRARGVALTFSPGVLLGCTDHHAWGVTNVSGDVQDLFVEHVADSRAEHDGVAEPLTVHREEIVVRGEDEPRVLSVREGRHGPLLDTFVSGMLHPSHVRMPPEPAYALSWVGLEHGIRPSLVLDVAQAESFGSFRAAALDGLACPGQNVVYADVEGTIGYACTGRYPLRASGDGTAPVPGWSDDHEWVGWVPTEDLPWGVDPQRGYLVSANHRMHDDGYPHLIGHDFHTPWRARRIAQVLASEDGHDVAGMAALQVDVVSLSARENVGLLLDRVEAGGAGRGGDRREAIGLLGSWDGAMTAYSAATAIYQTWCGHIARLWLEPRLGEEVFGRYHAWREPFQCGALAGLLRDGVLGDGVLGEALDATLAELRERLGEDASNWRWGDLHRVALAHPLAAIPGFEGLFVALEAGVGGDDQTVMQTGVDAREGGFPAAVIPSWRAVYDLADLDRSVGVLPAGNSGNPASAHWNDQAPLWLAGQTHPLPFTPAGVEAATVAVARLVPGTISG
jgi:penicillin amidase